MNNPFLWSKINAVQEEYLVLLKQLEPHVESDDFRYIINEIGIFWYSRRKLIRLVLKNIAEEKDAFLFCGASFLDVNEGEQWPFLATGRIHVVDDPLCKFADAIKQAMNSDFYKVIKQQLCLAFTDNISILESFFGKIILLPVSFVIKDIDEVDNTENAMIVLNSMLVEHMEPKELFAIADLNTLVSKFRSGVLASIVFCEEDTPTESIEIKLERYLTALGDPFGKITMAQKLIHVILGYLHQSLDILTMCGQFSLMPYIRANVVYSYMLSISQNIVSIKAYQQIVYGMMYAHSMYRFFDCDFSEINDTADCIRRIEEQTFSEMPWNPANLPEHFSEAHCAKIIEAAKNTAYSIRAAFHNCEE